MMLDYIGNIIDTYVQNNQDSSIISKAFHNPQCFGDYLSEDPFIEMDELQLYEYISLVNSKVEIREHDLFLCNGRLKSTKLYLMLKYYSDENSALIFTESKKINTMCKNLISLNSDHEMDEKDVTCLLNLLKLSDMFRIMTNQILNIKKFDSVYIKYTIKYIKIHKKNLERRL